MKCKSQLFTQFVKMVQLINETNKKIYKMFKQTKIPVQCIYCQKGQMSFA